MWRVSDFSLYKIFYKSFKSLAVGIKHHTLISIYLHCDEEAAKIFGSPQTLSREKQQCSHAYISLRLHGFFFFSHWMTDFFKVNSSWHCIIELSKAHHIILYASSWIRQSCDFPLDLYQQHHFILDITTRTVGVTCHLASKCCTNRCGVTSQYLVPTVACLDGV